MRKVLILSDGRLSGSTSLYVSTDYWGVFFDDRDFGMNSKINNTKKALENMQLKVVEVTKTNYTLENGLRKEVENLTKPTKIS